MMSAESKDLAWRQGDMVRHEVQGLLIRSYLYWRGSGIQVANDEQIDDWVSDGEATVVRAHGMRISRRI